MIFDFIYLISWFDLLDFLAGTLPGPSRDPPGTPWIYVFFEDVSVKIAISIYWPGTSRDPPGTLNQKIKK